MRFDTIVLPACLLLPLAAQDDDVARWRVGLGLGGGALEYDADLPQLRDTSTAGALRLGFEGTSRRGFGGGLRLESYGAGDVDFSGSPDEFELGLGSLFGHFTYRVHSHRFAMPVRIGLLANALTLDNTTSAADDAVTYSTAAFYAEFAPEFTLARRGETVWTLYGEVGVGGGGTTIEVDGNGEEWDSTTGFSGLEVGSRLYLGSVELSLAFVARRQSMDESDLGDRGSGSFPGYDATYTGAMFGFAMIF